MAEFRTLIGGLGMGESARWHENRLVIADWGAGEIVAVDLDGRRETVTGSKRTVCRSASTGYPTGGWW